MLGEETNGVSMTPVASRVSMLIDGLNINGVSMLCQSCIHANRWAKYQCCVNASSASRVSMLIGGLNINGVSMLAVPCFLLAIRFSQPASNHPS